MSGENYQGGTGYVGVQTDVRCVLEAMDWFEVELAFHRGLSVLCSFASVMDRMTDHPWNVMFAGEHLVCNESREQDEVSIVFSGV